MATTKSKPQTRKKLFAPTQSTKADRPAAEVKTRSQVKKHDAPKPQIHGNAISVQKTWVSPERVWKPKSQVWYLVSALVIMLCILVAVKLEYYVFVIALLAFLLLWFVQGTMAPWDVKHQLTTEGVFTFDTFHRWDELAYFWFADVGEWRVLYLDFQRDLNQQRLGLLVHPGEDLELFNMMISHLKYGEPYEIGFNLFAQFIYGKYLPITEYIPDLDKATTAEVKAEIKKRPSQSS